MEHNSLSKKFVAIIFLLIINLFCLWLFWIGLGEIRKIITLLQRCADVINVSSRAGFFIVFIGVPILCLLPIAEKVWSSFFKKHYKVINLSVIVGVIVFLVAGFLGSFGIRALIKDAGYIYCRNASGISALSRTLVYTKNIDICEKLTETKKDKTNQE